MFGRRSPVRGAAPPRWGDGPPASPLFGQRSPVRGGGPPRWDGGPPLEGRSRKACLCPSKTCLCRRETCLCPRETCLDISLSKKDIHVYVPERHVYVPENMSMSQQDMSQRHMSMSQKDMSMLQRSMGDPPPKEGCFFGGGRPQRMGPTLPPLPKGMAPRKFLSFVYHTGTRKYLQNGFGSLSYVSKVFHNPGVRNFTTSPYVGAVL